MNKCLLAALAAASVAASGCSAYREGGLTSSPVGLSAARDALEDGSLKERYPDSRSPSSMHYPDGATLPQARPAAQGPGDRAPSSAPWILKPLDREAERKSIARDSPYASVSPSGTAQGY